MIKLFLFALLPAAVLAQAEIAEIVTIRNGQIIPSNTVAHISQLADTAAQTQAALALAQATQQSALIISNELAELEALENARNATGYIRGFVESFSAGIEADTNMVASIVKLEAAGTTPTNALWDIYTYFTSDPGSWPIIRTSDTMLRTNAWDAAQSVSVELTSVVVGGTEYEAYRNRIALPLETTNMFFRTFVDVFGGGTNAMYFPVNNGIAVNGREPLTATLTDGTNVMEWVGGVRVQ
jgi:hypothetical protein